jgi:hypothetical protein
MLNGLSQVLPEFCLAMGTHDPGFFSKWPGVVVFSPRVDNLAHPIAGFTAPFTTLPLDVLHGSHPLSSVAPDYFNSKPPKPSQDRYAQMGGKAVGKG